MRSALIVSRIFRDSWEVLKLVTSDKQIKAFEKEVLGEVKIIIWYSEKRLSEIAAANSRMEAAFESLQEDLIGRRAYNSICREQKARKKEARKELAAAIEESIGSIDEMVKELSGDEKLRGSVHQAMTYFGLACLIISNDGSLSPREAENAIKNNIGIWSEMLRDERKEEL